MFKGSYGEISSSPLFSGKQLQAMTDDWDLKMLQALQFHNTTDAAIEVY